MSSHRLEVSFDIDIEGTKEFAEELRERIDDAVYELLNINCGQPECCPEPPGENYVPSASSFSTLHPPKKEEA